MQRATPSQDWTEGGVTGCLGATDRARPVPGKGQSKGVTAVPPPSPIGQAVAVPILPSAIAQAVAVQPVVPMAMAVPMQPVPAMHAPPTSLGTENFTKGIGYTPAVPAQQWRAPNLCDCGAAGV